MPVIDTDKIATIIREVAEDKIVPRFRQLEAGHVRSKSSPTDLVTIADEEAEIELTRIFKDVMPGSQVIGEEAVASKTLTRDALHDSDDYIWIVDPVDGTGNFVRGEPVFGTMVALVKGGERLASWIYQIPRERMITAQKGEGVRIDRKPFTPPAPIPADADFKDMSAFISGRYMPPSLRHQVEDLIGVLKDTTTRTCCAWEYVELLEGERAFSVYKRIEPWDHHAGVMLLEEAGFFVRKWDRTPYTTRDLTGGVVSAPSEELWDRAYKAFLEPALKLSVK